MCIRDRFLTDISILAEATHQPQSLFETENMIERKDGENSQKNYFVLIRKMIMINKIFEETGNGGKKSIKYSVFSNGF